MKICSKETLFISNRGYISSDIAELLSLTVLPHDNVAFIFDELNQDGNTSVSATHEGQENEPRNW